VLVALVPVLPIVRAFEASPTSALRALFAVVCASTKTAEGLRAYVTQGGPRNVAALTGQLQLA